MAALICTMGLIGAAINIGLYITSASRADSIIQALYDNGGEFPLDPKSGPRPDGFQLTEETPFETRYFIVCIGEDGKVESVDTDHIASIGRLEAAETAQRLAFSGRSEGYEDDYRFRVFDEGGSTEVIVLDCSLQMQTGSRLLLITLGVAAASAVVALAILVPLSGRATRPFAQNLARQRRFVTDASHELKTPLAIISANTDLIEAIAAEGDRALADDLAPWIESSKVQAARMDSLVKGMVELSRADEEGLLRERGDSDLGAAARQAAEEFSSLADSRELSLEISVDSGTTVSCSTDEANRICSILLDNAVKYSDAGGVIRIAVRRRKKAVELSVENPCETLRQEDVSHMFERFWRADASRSRETGGFGIGLATVKAIAERRGGRATASLRAKEVNIAVILPASRHSG